RSGPAAGRLGPCPRRRLRCAAVTAPAEDPAAAFLKACLAPLVTEAPGGEVQLAAELAGLGLEGIGRSWVRRMLLAMESEGLAEAAGDQGPFAAAQRNYRLTPEGVCWLRSWGFGSRSGAPRPAGAAT